VCCEATDKESSISLSVGDEQQPTRNSLRNYDLISSCWTTDEEIYIS
jgi:hypothetical protein